MGEGDELSGGEGNWWWEAVENRGHVQMPFIELKIGPRHSSDANTLQNGRSVAPKRHPGAKSLFESFPRSLPDRALASPAIIQPIPCRSSSCNSSPIENQIRLLILKLVI